VTVPRVGPRLIVIAVVVAVIAAGVGVSFFWWSLQRKNEPARPPGPDGPTLYQALGRVNATVRNTSGGPWILFSYIGFAPEGPFSPAAYGFEGGDNATLRDCQSQFNGLTVWNGSYIPIFNGSFASGNATFWQFEFFSNRSQEVIVATDVLGVPTVYAPLPLSNACIRQSNMEYAAPTYVSWVNPLPVDTSIQALAAYDYVGEAYSARHSPLMEMFADGWPPLTNINHGEGGGASYLRCGLVGAAGMQAKGVVGEYNNGQVQDTFNGSLSCTAVASGGYDGIPLVYTPYVVALTIPGTAVSIGGGETGFAFATQTEFAAAPGNDTIVDHDGWGLTSWMTQLSVRNAGGQNLTSTPLTCQAWVPSLADCAPNGSGWSAILLSPAGAWMDTYPSLTNSTAWAIPNVPLIGGEQIVVSYPGTWNVSGDQLIVGASSAVPAVSGSVTL